MPPLIPRRTRSGSLHLHSSRRALVASATAAEAGAPETAAARQAGAQDWQRRALGYYSLLGECWNPAHFFERGMGKVRFYAATLDEKGNPVEIEDGLAADAMEPINLVAPRYGLLTFLIGEGRLCQSLPATAQPGDDPVWEFLSTLEVRLTDEDRKIVRSSYGAGGAVEYENISSADGGGDPGPGQMRMWRFWRPHPMHSGLADSPVRPILDLYEQLWWLTMGERADIQNRIADNGLLLIPKEIDWSPPGAEAQAMEGDDPEVEPFTEYIGDLMMTAIGDPGSASASVPGVIRAPADLLAPDKFRILHTHDPVANAMFTSQREKSLIERIAIALEMPIAALTGIGNLNHWNAWKNDDEKWEHIEPTVGRYAADVANVYLRPLLRANGMSAAQAKQVVVAWDNSGFVNDPDRGKTAMQLHHDGLLSGEATLDANGWGEADRMEGEELDWWRAIQLRDATVGTGEEPEPEAEEEPPAEDDTPAEQAPAAEAELRDRAVRYATQRARAAAGALIRSAKRTCPECLDGFADVANADLPARAADRLTELRVSRDRLAQAAAEVFAVTLDQLGWQAADPWQAAAWFGLHITDTEDVGADAVRVVRSG